MAMGAALGQGDACRALVLASLLAASGGASAAMAQPTPPPARPPDIHFTPTRQAIAEAMLALAATGPADTVVDLGSGDGRLVILAAQRLGARGIGVEIRPDLVRLSRELAEEGGVADRVSFVEGDLREADLSAATVVVLYLSTTLTREITPKLRRELRPGARIVSQQFVLQDWPPDRSVTVEGQTLHLWTVPPR